MRTGKIQTNPDYAHPLHSRPRCRALKVRSWVWFRHAHLASPSVPHHAREAAPDYLSLHTGTCAPCLVLRPPYCKRGSFGQSVTVALRLQRYQVIQTHSLLQDRPLGPDKNDQVRIECKMSYLVCYRTIRTTTKKWNTILDTKTSSPFDHNIKSNLCCKTKPSNPTVISRPSHQIQSSLGDHAIKSNRCWGTNSSISTIGGQGPKIVPGRASWFW